MREYAVIWRCWGLEQMGNVTGSNRVRSGAVRTAAAALVLLHCAAGLAQNTDSSAEVHQKHGIAYLNQHNLPRALDEFRAAVLARPGEPVAHDYLGVALAESGRTEEATREFEEALRLSNDFTPAHFHLALALDRQGRTSEAIPEYEATLRIQPDLIEARYALSADCWKVGDWDGAIQLLRQVTERNPSFAAETRRNLGLELKQEGKLDEAVQEFKAAINLQSDSPELYLALAQTLTEKQGSGGAKASARKAVALARDRPESNYDLAEALRLKGDLEAAEAQFRRVLEVDPRYPYAHRQLGLVLRQKGSYDAAAAELKEAAEADPQDAEARYYLGSVLLKLNDVEHAVENFTEALRLNPYDSATHIALAGALNRMGKAQDAQAEIVKAQALDKLAADAGQSRVLLGSAVEHLKKGDVSSALDELRQAAQMSPEYPEVQLQLARALQMKGAAPAEVEKTLRRAVELKPDHAQAHLQLGIVLESMGRTAEAATEFRRARDLAPSLVEAHRALGNAARAARDWPVAVAEFGAIVVWNKDDREAQQELSFALAQRSQQRK